MTEVDYVDSNISSIVEDDPTLFENDKNQAKPFDPQQSSQYQEEQRNSNRDSGISSEKQKQQQQNQPKISEHMSRFPSDTKLHQSFENHDGKQNIMDYSINLDGKRNTTDYSKKFVELADNWGQRKVLKERRRSTVISSLPPASNMQEGARGEIYPTQFSDRLTPEVEIIHGEEKRESRQSKYEVPPLNEYDTRSKSNNIRLRRPSERRRSNSRKNYIQPLYVPPLSRPLSRNYDHRAHSKASCNNSGNSPARCCHHTTVYQYNNPPDNYHQQQYNFKSHSDPIRKQPTMEDDDDRILKKLAICAAKLARTKRIAKSQSDFDYNNDVFLPTVSSLHYAKSSYKKY